ncbi:response regulator [Stutzerimonas kirkiae]|uniref:ATP-binding response regulator n=1 Tax=Stutzerimonas kirkiae TaxID=2211392 RepID=UPI00103840B5|nr:hypothetical protein DNK08_04375 [Stutzerimonas kirkiae]
MEDRHDSAAQARLHGAEAQELLRRLRQALQVALLGMLRKQDVPANLARMGKVFARLEGLCAGAPLARLWQAAAGLVDELASGAVDNDSSVHSLLRQVDKELRRLLEDGGEGLSQPAADGLIDNLLFHSSRPRTDPEPARGEAPVAGPVAVEIREVPDAAPMPGSGHGFSTELIDMAWLVDVEGGPARELAAAAEPPPPDTELADTFLAEAVTFVERIGQGLRCWLQAPEDHAGLQALQRDLHTFKGGARLARQKHIGDLLHELEQHVRDVHGQAQSDLAALLQCHVELERAVAELRARHPEAEGTAGDEASEEATPWPGARAEPDAAFEPAAEPVEAAARPPAPALSAEQVAGRLRVLLRQLCDELGKQAELEVADAVADVPEALLGPLLTPLEHMLRNAIDHGIEAPGQRLALGKPEQGLVCLEAWHDGQDILLALSDDGAGIDLAAVREKAVELGLLAEDQQPEARQVLQLVLSHGLSTAGRVSPISGRGVGLDVAAVDIRQLGGTLDVESQPGIGTRFVIRLAAPATAAATPDEAPAQPATGEASAGGQEATGSEVVAALRVLVVDDSATVRKVTCRLLERSGMRVSVAHDGDDAIEQLQADRPDIMLLDIEMPNMGGFDVLTRIRQDEHLRDLPVVVITASSDVRHREQALGLGVDEYLGKPYQEEQLLGAIGRLTGREI